MPADKGPFLLLGGMTRGDGIFSRLLPLLPSAIEIDWIEPTPSESLEGYARRLATTFVVEAEDVLVGVSFGGFVVREMARVLNVRGCVLISSIASPNQLPPCIRILSRLTPQFGPHYLAAIGRAACMWPRRLRTRSTLRLTKLAGEKGAWHRWACAAVLRWSSTLRVEKVPMLQIHGEQDSTFPLRYVPADFVIKGGGHSLPLSHPHEVVAALRQARDTFSRTSRACDEVDLSLNVLES